MMDRRKFLGGAAATAAAVALPLPVDVLPAVVEASEPDAAWPDIEYEIVRIDHGNAYLYPEQIAAYKQTVAISLEKRNHLPSGSIPYKLFEHLDMTRDTKEYAQILYMWKPGTHVIPLLPSQMKETS